MRKESEILLHIFAKHVSTYKGMGFMMGEKNYFKNEFLTRDLEM